MHNRSGFDLLASKNPYEGLKTLTPDQPYVMLKNSQNLNYLHFGEDANYPISYIAVTIRMLFQEN